ncbi:MAG: RNA polymerase-binding protein DksA [Candidatus Neomarinimicrobiota bacterium]|nr:MAG: RNA polymerase-binding protein DksA [Candidatus Neomarinimicrobiota bacterium]
MSQKKYSKTKLASFKKQIKAKLENLENELDDSRGNLESSTGGSSSLAQESVYSVHMADAGTDSYEREKGYHFLNRQTDYHKSLTKALERIEDGTFGVCSISGELIPEERMLEVPNTTKRVEAKEREKLNL